MEETMISEYARGLRDAHGDRAIAMAAQRAAEYERNKDKEEAKTWRQVEAALKAMQGPLAS
jgi:phage shock protein A